LTNSQGQAVWQWAYSAFGDEKPTLAKHRFADLDLISNLGTTNISSVEFNVRWPGQYFDKNSGLHYNYFRTYCPTCGRYTQPDPIGLRGGWNRIPYVDGNPLNDADPFGLARKMVNLGKDYTGGIDTFDVGGRSSFEIHVYDGAGKEVGIYGPNGWFDKHGLRGAPEGLPSSVEAQCEGQAIDVGRRMGKIPPKGQVDISKGKWRRFFGKLPLIGPMIEMTRPSPERGCEINPFAAYCQEQ
jgi:RHS repeat-associated protein